MKKKVTLNMGPTIEQLREAIVLFDKKYEGFQSLYNLMGDVCEAVDADGVLESEFQGTVHVIIVYTPKKSRIID